MSPARAVLAASLLLACKGQDRDRPRAAVAEPAPVAAPAPAAETTASLAAKTWSDAACEPSTAPAAKQRAGYADLTLEGDGLGEKHTNLPALCGALHTEATKRFAVGDGTLFRVCIPGGARFQISADVVLSGPVSTEFVHDGTKKTGPLIELYRPDLGTYNQRDVPGESDKLVIAFDWSTVETEVDVVWPSKKDRAIRVAATFRCGAMR